MSSAVFAPGAVRLARAVEFEKAFAGIAGRAAAADRAGQLPPENWAEVVDSGYLRALQPASEEGLGGDGIAQAMVMECLARACGGTYWSATMSGLVCASLIRQHAPAVEHPRLLGPVMAGDRVACFAVVERSAGSDPSTYRTLVRRGGSGGWVIDGEKARIANAPVAELAVVLARLEPSGGREPGWCFAFVDLRQDGVRRYSLDPMGLRAMPWGGLVFEGARVADSDVIPVSYDEYGAGMVWGWLFISVSSLAIAEQALTASAEHAAHRLLGDGRPLSALDGIRTALVDMRTRTDAARLLVWRAAEQHTRGQPARELAAMAKIQATETAVGVVNRAVQIHGSWALTRGHVIERLYRDAPMNVIGGFASDRLRTLAADTLFGGDR